LPNGQEANVPGGRKSCSPRRAAKEGQTKSGRYRTRDLTRTRRKNSKIRCRGLLNVKKDPRRNLDATETTLISAKKIEQAAWEGGSHLLATSGRKGRRHK